MTRPKRIAFWGNFGTRNLGNECTLSAALANARARRPEATFVCFCTAPEDAQTRHGLPCFPLHTALRRKGEPPPSWPSRIARRLSAEVRGWREALHATKGLELLVMTGTGMLTDEGEGPMGLPYAMFRWAVAARLSGCRLAFLSVGVEGLHHVATRFFIRTALRLASFRSYRDVQSKERLRAAGFLREDDAVYPDLAFSLPEALCRPSPLAPGARPRIGVGLYAYRDRGEASPEDKALYRAYVEKVCTLVGALRARSHAVRLLIGDNTYDEPVLEDVREALRARGLKPGTTGLEDAAADSFEALLEQLCEVDVVVASRFHNVLLALLLGKPVLSLSYNEKNDALLRDMGFGAYAGSLDAFDVERTLAQLSRLQEGAAQLLPGAAEKARAYRQALEAQYDRVFGPKPPSPAQVPSEAR